MPRSAKPARLWLRKRGARKTWVILDGGKQFATHCSQGDRRAAEAALAAHIAATRQPNRDSGRDPSQIAIAEILNIYLLDMNVTRPKALAARVGRLLNFFGEKPVAAINRRLCRDYAASRKAPQAARRELEDLKAALGHARAEEILTVQPVIELPAKAPPRDRWLTRSEAARLLSACRAPKWRHIARFILVALYTGTRSAAILNAAVGPAIGRPYVDLEAGVFYRRAPGTTETKKRQPPVRLPARLLAHIRRWNRRGLSMSSVIEYAGRPVRRGVDQGFARAVKDAGLEGKVTPHCLRHSSISWAMQGGAEIWDVSAFFGISPQLVMRVYGHFHPDAGSGVAKALMRKR